MSLATLDPSLLGKTDPLLGNEELVDGCFVSVLGFVFQVAFQKWACSECGRVGEEARFGVRIGCEPFLQFAC